MSIDSKPSTRAQSHPTADIAPRIAPRIAITAGEPAGIGPDLCLWLASQQLDACISVIACKQSLQARLAQSQWLSDQAIAFIDGPAQQPQRPGQLNIIDIPVAETVQPGQLNPANATQVLQLLDHAMQGCEAGDYDAMVTAPLQKSVINEAQSGNQNPFTGHTEYLADYFDCQTVMLLAADQLRVALATTHLPLRAVPDAITADGLESILRILQQDLQCKFGIKQPTILVCGLNPHAGESGHLGREEIEIIEPLLNKLRAEGMKLEGPLPADTLFVPKHLQHADAVLAMYHDQGLPVLKHAGFGRAVNITLGLPIIRTSVDHGTALDLAGSANIDTGSMAAAIESAIQQSQARATGSEPASISNR